MEVQRRQRRRVTDKPQHSVWAESNKKGGFIIYCGIKGTDAKTVAGAAAGIATALDHARGKLGCDGVVARTGDGAQQRCG